MDIYCDFTNLIPLSLIEPSGKLKMSVRMRDIMVTKVVTTTNNSTLEEAVKLMNDHEIGCLIVTENKKAVGILTERDLLKRILAKSENLKRIRVEEVMSTPLVSVEPTVEIGDASKLMFEKNIKKMPIIKKRRVAWVSNSNGYPSNSTPTHQNVQNIQHRACPTTNQESI